MTDPNIGPAAAPAPSAPGFLPEARIESFTPPQERFRAEPATGLPVKLMAFIPQRDRTVPLMTGAPQPAVFQVDEKTQTIEHFEILTYNRIRKEVLAEIAPRIQAKPETPAPAVPAAPPASEPSRLGMAALENLENVGRTGGSGPAEADPAADRIRSLEAERDVLVRLAGKIEAEIAVLKIRSRMEESKI